MSNHAGTFLVGFLVLVLGPCHAQGEVGVIGGKATVRHSVSPERGGVGISNGTFDHGLDDWTVTQYGGAANPGRVFVDQGEAQMLEGDSFLVTLSQTFDVPASPELLCFDLKLMPGFDRTAQGIPDAFEVHVLDQNNKSIVPTWDPLATSFFNVQEDGTMLRGATTVWDGLTAKVDVRHVLPGTRVTLFVDLIGGDSDEGSGVRVDNFCLTTSCAGNLPPVVLSAPPGLRIDASVGVPVSFTVEFGPPEPEQTIDAITVDASGLRNFAFDPPTLGRVGSVTCHFLPDATQVTPPTLPHRVRIRASDSCAPAGATEIVIALHVSECYLMLGLEPLSMPLGGGDTLLVVPLAVHPVTEIQIPRFTIPNVPTMQGIPVFAQVGMLNESMFPSDPLQLSNGLRIELGAGTSAYGTGSGIDLWAATPPALGGTLRLAFKILGT
jgi:hypothetical protein